MSFYRLHRGVTAFVFALALIAVATKGLCLMPDAAASGAPDAHACCKKGADILVAGCCMDGQTDPNAATQTVRVPGPAPAGAAFLSRGATNWFLPAVLTALTTDRLHSPSPPPVIRV